MPTVVNVKFANESSKNNYNQHPGTKGAYIGTTHNHNQIVTWQFSTESEAIAESSQVIFVERRDDGFTAIRNHYRENVKSPVTFVEEKSTYVNGIRNDYFMYDPGQMILLTYKFRQDGPLVVQEATDDIVKILKSGQHPNEINVQGLGWLCNMGYGVDRRTYKVRNEFWKRGIHINLTANEITYDPPMARAAQRRYLTILKKKEAKNKALKKAKSANKKSKINGLKLYDFFELAYQMERLVCSTNAINSRYYIAKRPYTEKEHYGLMIQKIQWFIVIGNDMFGTGWHRSLKGFKHIRRVFNRDFDKVFPEVAKKDSDLRWFRKELKKTPNTTATKRALNGEVQKTSTFYQTNSHIRSHSYFKYMPSFEDQEKARQNGQS